MLSVHMKTLGHSIISSELEFTNGDLFDQEVIKSMRAYAKTIARESFQAEIQECVTDTAKKWAQMLYERRYTAPMTDKFVRAEVEGYIKKQMENKEMRDLVQRTVSEEIKVCQNEVMEYAREEAKKYLSNAFVAITINDAIKEAVPQAVLDALMKVISKNEGSDFAGGA